jgi:hypothetical protein
MRTSQARDDFDAVAFKRDVQAQVSEEIKGLSPQEEIAYFRKAAESGPLGAWWRSIRSNPAVPRTRG